MRNQICSYLEGLYCIFSKNFPEIKISGNFRKGWNKFPEIVGLTTLVISCLNGDTVMLMYFM